MNSSPSSPVDDINAFVYYLQVIYHFKILHTHLLVKYKWINTTFSREEIDFFVQISSVNALNLFVHLPSPFIRGLFIVLKPLVTSEDTLSIENPGKKIIKSLSCISIICLSV